MTMVPTPVSLSRPSTGESTHTNDLSPKADSPLLNLGPDSPDDTILPRNRPKARNKFTLPSSTTKINNISPSAMKHMEEEEKARKQVEEDLANGIVTRTTVYEDPPADSHENRSPSSQKMSKKSSTVHGSMENIFRPKNHSITALKKSEYSDASTTPYRELKLKTKTKSLGSGLKYEKELSTQPGSSALLPSPSNETLLYALNIERKKILMQKVVLAFVSSGIKRKNKLIGEMEDHISVKTQECAARLILHHLLLNSWRHGQQDVLKFQEENSQLIRTNENLCLQLRVVRHCQNNDREKIAEKSSEINTLKTELCQLTEEITRKDFENDKVEGELNELQYKVELLNEEKFEIKKGMKIVAEKNEMLMHSVDLEKKRCNKLEGQIHDLKRQENELRKQLREITAQSSHWQEKARASESDVWELKLQIETRDKNVAQLQESCSSVQKEIQEISKEKCQLESKLLKTKEVLETTVIEKERVEESTKELEKEFDTCADTVVTLENELDAKKQECNKILKELYSYKLKNVARRRAWGNALYYIFSPLVALKVITGEKL